ncbi:hypothetical protein ACFU5O_20785 [Streptomyces sp. NPDC057445]|uniref:hypothetical protein n=1 Tax=Streptomyces sp. NPDC057445 TaxID=3346136 RepID=UPI003678694A
MFHKALLTSAEKASHIKHHLGVAGRSDQLFTDDAVTLIHTTSRGFSRAVNNLCLQSLAVRAVEVSRLSGRGRRPGR